MKHRIILKAFTRDHSIETEMTLRLPIENKGQAIGAAVTKGETAAYPAMRGLSTGSGSRRRRRLTIIPCFAAAAIDPAQLPAILRQRQFA
jgi:hypothetical protein